MSGKDAARAAKTASSDVSHDLNKYSQAYQRTFPALAWSGDSGARLFLVKGHDGNLNAGGVVWWNKYEDDASAGDSSDQAQAKEISHIIGFTVKTDHELVREMLEHGSAMKFFDSKQPISQQNKVNLKVVDAHETHKLLQTKTCLTEKELLDFIARVRSYSVYRKRKRGEISRQGSPPEPNVAQSEQIADNNVHKH